MAESNKEEVFKYKTTNLKGKKIKLNKENKDKYNVGYIIYKEKSSKYYKITKITETNVYAKILTTNVKDDITYFEMNTESKEKDLYGKNFIVYNVNEIEQYQEELFSDEVDSVNKKFNENYDTQEHDQEKRNDMDGQQVAESTVDRNEQDEEAKEKALTELNEEASKETIKKLLKNESQSTSSNNTENKYTKEELDKKTIKDLKELCKELSIPNHSKLKKLNKDEYINAILNKNTIKTTVKETSLKKNESSIKKKRKTNKLIYENKDENIEELNIEKEKKEMFIKTIKKCQELSRSAGVTGDDFFDDFMYILFLCKIENTIKNGDMYNFLEFKSYNKNEDDICDEDYFKKLTPYLKISYLLEKQDELIKSDYGISSIEKCGILLMNNINTKDIIKKKKFINLNNNIVLFDILNIAFNEFCNKDIFITKDLIGIGYEFISSKHGGNGGTSKELGQYFTERPLILMCFVLIDKEDIKEFINNDSSIGDEFCATFGFPLYLKEYLNKLNIKIKDKNIYGVEYSQRLFRFAKMNSMFTLTNNENIVEGNSFVTNISPHLDFSVHNVPFGHSIKIENVKDQYKEYKSENPNCPNLKEIVPIEVNDCDAVLASQLVLYKTKKMGLCIIKDGKETSGKKKYIEYRKWFCEKCIIKKIMKIPSGAFSSTGTKTVCIYFIKKEGKQTENIQFLQLSDDGTKINEICNVSIEELKQNNYSWEPNSYIIDETLEKMMAKSTCEWRKLGDICDIKTGIDLTKEKQQNMKGVIPYIGSGKNSVNFINEYMINDLFYVTGRVGTIGETHIYEGKYWINGNAHYIICENKIILKYSYYFLKCNNSQILNKMIGSDRSRLNVEDLKNINIPIPSIEKQKECVKILDDLTTQKQLLNDRKSGIKRQMKYYFETQIKINKEVVKIRKLGDICEIKNGTSITKDKLKTGNIQVVGGGVKPLGFHNIHNLEKNTILISKDGANAGFVSIYDNPIFATGHALFINNIHLNVKKFYLYYILKHFESQLYNFQTGGGQPGVNKDELKDNLNIPILPIEKQKEIVQYLDKLEKEKNEIIEKINKIDKLMKDVLELSYN